jgi:hypothetical protein
MATRGVHTEIKTVFEIRISMWTVSRCIKMQRWIVMSCKEALSPKIVNIDVGFQLVPWGDEGVGGKDRCRWAKPGVGQANFPATTLQTYDIYLINVKPVNRPPKTGCKWSNNAPSSSSFTPSKGSKGSSLESTALASVASHVASAPEFPLSVKI